jgi:electron transport complex protein RnfD
MTSIPHPASSPHAHDRSTVNRIMGHVCLALLPTTLFGLYLFGWPAINLFLLTCGSAIATELVCLKAQGQPMSRLLDGTALLTGWLIALSIPPWAPWWIGVGGAFFAISFGKHLYGGVGQNIFNPAMLARIALLIAFPVQMTSWVFPGGFGSTEAPGFMSGLAITFGVTPIPDGVSGATALGHLKTAFTLNQDARDVLANDFSLQAAFFGHTPGSLGETSELLVLLGGLWLLALRIITWEIPVAILGTVAVLSLIASGLHPERYAGPLFHLCSGGMLLGAFFIATDPVTSPVTQKGRILFGIGCGFVTWVIRSWGGFPEAMGFGVLFMNAFTPLIDRYLRPRAYGRTLSGNPLKVAALTDHVKQAGKV